MVVRERTSWNIMLDGYVKACELVSARKVFDEMSWCNKDDVSYNTMIVGFARNGCFEEAFSCLRDLLRRGAETTRANEASLTGVLSACLQSGSFEFGKTLCTVTEKTLYMLFDDMIESGVRYLLFSHGGLVVEGEKYFLRMMKDYYIEPTIEHFGCMVDLYGRAGKLGKAYAFIREMPIPVTATGISN
ncbi:unnamed protein product [Cochlearia groenlandica]